MSFNLKKWKSLLGLLSLSVFVFSSFQARAESLNAMSLVSAAMAGYGAYYSGNSSVKCFVGGSSPPATPMFCNGNPCVSYPPNVANCAMGVLYGAGALVMADAAIKAINTSKATKSDGFAQPLSFDLPNPTNPMGPPKKVTATDLVNLKSKIVDSMKATQGAGYTVNSDGSVTLKNGTKIAASAVGTTAGLKAMGLSDAEAQKVLAEQQQSAQDLAKAFPKIAALNSGYEGGGIKSKAVVRQQNTMPDFGKLLQGMNQQAPSRSPAAAVPQKLFNGEAIGVASSNIFATVSQRYSSEQQAGSFILGGTPAATNRSGTSGYGSGAVGGN